MDYLLAEANQNLVSRWGHSMLRLVICKPGRPRGPDCRLDLDQSLVLSYRAFVNDVQLSSWDGLVGNYPSRLFVLPLGQVIDEYTKTELRSLASIPLRLGRQEVENLVRQAAEMHWGYDGNYYFLSNNCAVESLKLLRSGTANPRLNDLDSIMPNGLLEVLKGRGIADTSVLDDPREALRLGYRFDSYRDRYQAMFQVLKQHLPVPQASVEAWLEQPPAQRQQWFAQADLRTSAALLLLEQAGLRRLAAQLEQGLVLADQDRGAGVARQFHEFLVVAVGADRQADRFGVRRAAIDRAWRQGGKSRGEQPRVSGAGQAHRHQHLWLHQLPPRHRLPQRTQ